MVLFESGSLRSRKLLEKHPSHCSPQPLGPPSFPPATPPRGTSSSFIGLLCVGYFFFSCLHPDKRARLSNHTPTSPILLAPPSSEVHLRFVFFLEASGIFPRASEGLSSKTLLAPSAALCGSEVRVALHLGLSQDTVNSFRAGIPSNLFFKGSRVQNLIGTL